MSCWVRHLPLAKDLVRSSRQQLVAHLDGYAKRNRPLFEKVAHAITQLFTFPVSLHTGIHARILQTARCSNLQSCARDPTHLYRPPAGCEPSRCPSTDYVLH